MRKVCGSSTPLFAIIFSLVFFLLKNSSGQEIKAYGLKLLWTYPLGDVSFHARAGHSPDSFVTFSPDGRYLALGTYDGRILVFNSRSGKLIFGKKIPEAMIKKLTFSPDGKILYYGEQSPEGKVCALELCRRKTLWCFSTEKDLQRGTPPPPGDLYGIYHLPGIYRLKTLASGDLLALGVHTWFDRKRRLWRRLSRIYRLDPGGKLIWAYPWQGPAPATIIYADSDPRGEKVAAIALLPSEDSLDHKKFKGPPPQSFLALDGKTGRPLFFYPLKPLRPYFDRVAAWESVAISPDACWAAIGTADGRLFIMDLTNKKLARVLKLATPIKLGPFPVSASLGYGLFGTKTLFVLSGESSIPYGMPLAIDRPSGPHPAARTLFAIDPKRGKILWRFVSPFKLQGLALSADGRYLAVAAAAFRRENKSFKQFGILLFDLKKRGGGLSKFCGYFPTQGTCFFHLAISPEGELVAVVENPWQDSWGRLFGKHRLLVLKYESYRANISCARK